MKAEHVLLQSPSQKPNSMFGQKSFPIKHTFIHYDSPRKTLAMGSPPKSVPPNFAPQPNFAAKPGPQSYFSTSLQPAAPMQTLRLFDYLSSPPRQSNAPATHGTVASMGAQGSMNCGVVNAPVPPMPEFASGQIAQGGISGFPPVPPLPGPGQLVGPSVEGNGGNSQQAIMMGPCMEGNQCQQMTMGGMDCSQQNCQPSVVMTQAVDNNGQTIMMGPMNDGSGNFVIGQMVELAPSWGECSGGIAGSRSMVCGNSGNGSMICGNGGNGSMACGNAGSGSLVCANASSGSMFSQCLFQTGMNGMSGQCQMIVDEPSPMSMISMTPCNGGQVMQVSNGGNSFCMNSASSGNAMPAQSSSQSKLFRPQGRRC